MTHSATPPGKPLAFPEPHGEEEFNHEDREGHEDENDELPMSAAYLEPRR